MREDLRVFRAAFFAIAYAMGLLVVAVLGGCTSLNAASFGVGWLAIYVFCSLAGGVSPNVMNSPYLGLLEPIPYIVIALVGICGRSIRVFRMSFVVFATLLVLNIASCVAMGGCFRGE